MPQIQFHPACEAFPLMEGSSFDSLVADVRAHGLLNPITLHRNGVVLDGRNRLRACTAARVEPHFVTFPGTDAEIVPFVIAQNVKRRHLDESQRAMVAAKLANLTNGQQARHASPIGEAVSESQAAKLLNVGKRTVERARKVQDNGVPELVAAVERGQVSVSAAAAVAELPKSKQTQAVADDAVAELAADLRRRHSNKPRVAPDPKPEKLANRRLARQLRKDEQQALDALKDWLRLYSTVRSFKRIRDVIRVELRKRGDL